MRSWLLLVSTLAFPMAVTHAQLVDSTIRELSKPEKQLVQICEEMYATFDKYYTIASGLKDDAEREKYYADNDPSAKYVAILTKFESDNHGTHAGLMAARRMVLKGQLRRSGGCSHFQRSM